MNERIQELAEQALQLVADEHTNGDESRLDTDSYYVKDLIQEKFAELIVRECANLFVDRRYMVLNPLEPFADERVRVLKEHDKDTVKKIKQHFGVEL